MPRGQAGETFLVYRNRFNEVKPYRVEVIEADDQAALVWDRDANKSKTFLVRSILAKCDSWDDAHSTATKLQRKYAVIPRNPTGRTYANPDRKFEVCFTGFAKADKQALIAAAEGAGLFVRAKVTQNLGALVCGQTAGWSKLREAHRLRVRIISGAEDFKRFVETGEFPE